MTTRWTPRSRGKNKSVACWFSRNALSLSAADAGGERADPRSQCGVTLSGHRLSSMHHNVAAGMMTDEAHLATVPRGRVTAADRRKSQRGTPPGSGRSPAASACCTAEAITGAVDLGSAETNSSSRRRMPSNRVGRGAISTSRAETGARAGAERGFVCARCSGSIQLFVRSLPYDSPVCPFRQDSICY